MDLCEVTFPQCNVYICKYEQCIPIELLSKNCYPAQTVVYQALGRGVLGSIPAQAGESSAWTLSTTFQEYWHSDKLRFLLRKNSPSMFIITVNISLAIHCW